MTIRYTALPTETVRALQGGGQQTPEILTTAPDYLIKGYSADERIVYGTGAVVSREDLAARAGDILNENGVAWVHVRSARNNCYQCRIDGD